MSKINKHEESGKSPLSPIEKESPLSSGFFGRMEKRYTSRLGALLFNRGKKNERKGGEIVFGTIDLERGGGTFSAGAGKNQKENHFSGVGSEQPKSVVGRTLRLSICSEKEV